MDSSNRFNKERALETESVQGLSGLKGVNTTSTNFIDRANYYNAMDSNAPSSIDLSSSYEDPNVRYSKYNEEAVLASDLNDLNALRAREQSGLLKGVNAVVGGAMSGLLTAGETLGYVGGGFQDNSFSQGMRELKDELYNEIPIYETNDGTFTDQFFSYSTLRSTIDSAVGFAIPGGVVGKSIGLAAKGLRAARLLNFLQGTGKIAEGVSSALAKAGSNSAINNGIRDIVGGLIMNQAEGTMMAVEVGENAEKDYIDNKVQDLRKVYPDMDIQSLEDRARKIMEVDTDFQAKVGKAQTEFKQANTLMLFSDVMTFGGIFRGKGATRELLKDPTIARRAAEYGKVALGEGVEELYQGILSKEKGYEIRESSNLLTDEEKKANKDITDRIIEYALDTNTLVEAAMGFVSGPGQRKFTKAFSDISNGDNIWGSKRHLAEKEEYVKQQSLLSNLKEEVYTDVLNTENLRLAAEERDLPELTKLVNNSAFVNRAFAHFKVGTTEQLERELQDYSEGKVEGVDLDENAKSTASQMLQDLYTLEKEYNRAEGSHFDEEVIKRRYINKMLAQTSKDMSSKIEENRSNLLNLISTQDNEESNKAAEDINNYRKGKSLDNIPTWIKSSEEYIKFINSVETSDKINKSIVTNNLAIKDIVSGKKERVFNKLQSDLNKAFREQEEKIDVARKDLVDTAFKDSNVVETYILGDKNNPNTITNVAQVEKVGEDVYKVTLYNEDTKSFDTPFMTAEDKDVFTHKELFSEVNTAFDIDTTKEILSKHGLDKHLQTSIDEVLEEENIPTPVQEEGTKEPTNEAITDGERGTEEGGLKESNPLLEAIYIRANNLQEGEEYNTPTPAKFTIDKFKETPLYQNASNAARQVFDSQKNLTLNGVGKQNDKIVAFISKDNGEEIVVGYSSAEALRNNIIDIPTPVTPIVAETIAPQQPIVPQVTSNVPTNTIDPTTSSLDVPMIFDITLTDIEDKDIKGERVGKDPAQRTVIDYFSATTSGVKGTPFMLTYKDAKGNTVQYNDKEGLALERWYDFLELYPRNNDTSITETFVGKVIPTSYNGNKSYILAIIDKQGNYVVYNKDTGTTEAIKEFDPIKAVWTSMPDPNVSYNSLSNGISNRVPIIKDSNGEGYRITEQAYEKYRKAYKNFIDNNVTGEDVNGGFIVSLEGASNGIAVKDAPIKQSSTIDDSNVTIKINNEQTDSISINLSNGIIKDINLKKGDAIILNPLTGEYNYVHTNKISEADIEYIVTTKDIKTFNTERKYKYGDFLNVNFKTGEVSYKDKVIGNRKNPDELRVALKDVKYSIRNYNLNRAGIYTDRTNNKVYNDYTTYLLKSNSFYVADTEAMKKNTITESKYLRYIPLSSESELNSVAEDTLTTTTPIAILEKATERTLSEEEQSILDSEGLPDFMDLEKRVDYTLTHRREKVSEAISWFQSKFPNVPISVIPTLLNNTAYGIFKNNTIIISEQAVEGTVYHEAFHTVSQLFMKDGERAAIYEAISNDSTYTDYMETAKRLYPELSGDSLAEEALAEAFRDYMLQSDKERNATGWLQSIKNFFNKILNWIGVINNNEELSLIENTFNRIKNNTYSDAQRVNALSPMIAQKKVDKELTLFYKDTMESMHHYMMTYLKNNSKNGIFDVILNSDPDTFKNALIFTSAKFKQAYTHYDKTGNKALADNIGFIIDNWSKFLSHYNDYIKQFGLESLYNEDSITSILEENSIEENKGKDSVNQFESSIFINGKENSSMATKLLVSMLSLTDEANKPTLNNLGLMSSANFSETFNILANGLTNTNSDVSMEALRLKLEELSKVNPAIKQLYIAFSKKVIDPTTKKAVDKTGKSILGIDNPSASKKWSGESMLQYIKFLQSFAKNKNIYELNFIGQGGAWTTINSNYTGVKRKILFGWNRTNLLSLRKNEGKFIQQEGTTIYNKDYYSKYRDITAKDNVDDRVIKADTFLKDVGIILPAIAIKEAVSTSEGRNRINGIIKAAKEGLANVLTNTRSNYNDLEYLVQLQIKYNNKFDNSHYNGSKKRVYDNALNSFVTNIKNKLNQANSKEDIVTLLPHLDAVKAPYLNNSVILNNFKTGSKDSINKIEIVIIEGNTEDSSRKHKEFNALNEAETLAMRVNLIPQGKYIMLRPSNNTLERALSVGKSLIEYNDIISQDSNKILNIFKGYLLDELNRSLTVENFKFFNKNKNSGIIIDSIFSKKDKDKLFKSELTVRNFIDNLNNPNSKASIFLEEKVNDLILTRAKGLGNKMAELGLVQVGPDNIISLKGVNISKDIVGDTMTDLVEKKTTDNKGTVTITNTVGKNNFLEYCKFLAANTIVGSVEQTKLFFGDPVYYKSVEDKFKRHSGAIGTKKLLFTGNEINTYIDANLKRQTIDNKWTSKKGLTYKGKPVTRTAIFEDVQVISNSIGNILETLDKDNPAYIESKAKYTDSKELINYLNDQLSKGKITLKSAPYFDMTEGDGFGYISLDGYREWKFRAGDWNESAEKLYQWEVQERNNIPVTERVYTPIGSKESVELKYGDWGDMVFNSLKPQYYGPMAEKGYHTTMYKCSLMPLIPSVTKGTNLELLHNQMIKNTIDVTVHYSANKGVTTKTNEDGSINSFYNNEGDFNASDSNNWLTQDTYVEHWGLQLDTGDHAKNSVVWGTQQAKQVLNGLMNNGEVSDKFSGERKEVVKSLLNDYLKYNEERLKIARDILKDKLGVIVKDNKWDISEEGLQKLVDTLSDAALTRGLDSNYIEAIESIKRGITIDNLLDSQRIENMLMSIARSTTTSSKRNGKASYQVAATMFEKQGVSRKGVGRVLSGSNDLTFTLHENGAIKSMEVYLPNHLIDKDIDITKVDKRLLQLIGFRIPTQYTSSIESITVKGFLPKEAGDIVVVPSEIVAKAGSDFDIDKLNIYIPNSYIDSKGNLQYLDYDNIDSIINELESIKERNLINSLAKSVTEDKVFENIVRGIISISSMNKSSIISTINDRISDSKDEDNKVLLTKLREFVEQLDDNKLTINSNNIYMQGLENKIQSIQNDILTMPEMYSQLISPLNAETLKSDASYINRLRNNKEGFDSKQSLSVLTDAVYLNSLNETFLGGTDGIGPSALFSTFHIMCQLNNVRMMGDIKLSHNSIKEGEIILGALKNADNQEIAELFNQWISAGADIVKEPYMKDLNASMKTLNTILFLTLSGVPSRTVALFMNQPIIRDYTALQTVFESQIAEENNLNASKDSILQKAKSKYPSTSTEVINSISAEDLNNNIKGEIDNALQRAILDEYIKYQDYAKIIADAIKKTTYDTKGAGSSIGEALFRLHNSSQIDESLINFDKILDSSFIKPYKQAAEEQIDAFQPLFSSLQDNSFYVKEGIKNGSLNKFMDYISEKPIPQGDALNNIRKYMKDYTLNNIIRNPLLSKNADSTIAKSGRDYLNSTANKVSELQSNPSFRGNNLINSLEVVTNIEGDLQIFPTFSNLISLEKEQLTADWEALNAIPITLEEGTTTSLAKGLLISTIVQSGLTDTPNQFISLAPNHLYESLINVTNKGNINFSKDLFKAYLMANITDNALVPKRVPKDSTSYYPFTKKYVRQAIKDSVTGKVLGNTFTLAVKNREGKVLMVDNKPVDPRTNNYRENKLGIYYGSKEESRINEALNNLENSSVTLSNVAPLNNTNNISTNISESNKNVLSSQNLTEEERSILKSKGISEEEFNSLSDKVKKLIVKC